MAHLRFGIFLGFLAAGSPKASVAAGSARLIAAAGCKASTEPSGDTLVILKTARRKFLNIHLC